MAKQTLEQKIEKTEEAILKEEMAIEESKEKIKKLKAELKSLKSEKEKVFANEIIEIIKAKGISHEKLIADLNAVSVEKSEGEKTSESQNNDTDFDEKKDNAVTSSSQNFSVQKWKTERSDLKNRFD